MYEAFYGLRERPFDLTPNPTFLYLSGGHLEALSVVHYGIVGRKGNHARHRRGRDGQNDDHPCGARVRLSSGRTLRLPEQPDADPRRVLRVPGDEFRPEHGGRSLEGEVPARVRAIAPRQEPVRGVDGARDRRGSEPVARTDGGGPPAGEPRDPERQAAARRDGRSTGTGGRARSARVAATETTGRAARGPVPSRIEPDGCVRGWPDTESRRRSARGVYQGSNRAGSRAIARHPAYHQCRL